MLGRRKIKQGIFELDGVPYFLQEKASGVFVAVNRIIANKGGDYIFAENKNLGELALHHHITEINLHGQPILVKQPVSCDQLEYIVNELRKFAENMGYKYFGAEFFGRKYIGELIITEGNINYWEVRPRLFVDNN